MATRCNFYVGRSTKAKKFLYYKCNHGFSDKQEFENMIIVVPAVETAGAIHTQHRERRNTTSLNVIFYLLDQSNTLRRKI